MSVRPGAYHLDIHKTVHLNHCTRDHMFQIDPFDTTQILAEYITKIIIVDHADHPMHSTYNECQNRSTYSFSCIRLRRIKEGQEYMTNITLIHTYYDY
jgi:hypothetical protein